MSGLLSHFFRRRSSGAAPCSCQGTVEDRSDEDFASEGEAEVPEDFEMEDDDETGRNASLVGYDDDIDDVLGAPDDEGTQYTIYEDEPYEDEEQGVIPGQVEPDLEDAMTTAERNFRNQMRAVRELRERQAQQERRSTVPQGGEGQRVRPRPVTAMEAYDILERHNRSEALMRGWRELRARARRSAAQAGDEDEGEEEDDDAEEEETEEQQCQRRPTGKYDCSHGEQYIQKAVNQARRAMVEELQGLLGVGFGSDIAQNIRNQLNMHLSDLRRDGDDFFRRLNRLTQDIRRNARSRESDRANGGNEGSRQRFRPVAD